MLMAEHLHQLSHLSDTCCRSTFFSLWISWVT